MEKLCLQQKNAEQSCDDLARPCAQMPCMLTASIHSCLPRASPCNVVFVLQKLATQIYAMSAVHTVFGMLCMLCISRHLHPEGPKLPKPLNAEVQKHAPLHLLN